VYLGCIPDEKDDQDRKYEEFCKASPSNEPINLDKWLPPIWNQKEGSCTCMAVAASITTQRFRLLGDNSIPAVLFLYFMMRAMDNNQNRDIGGSIRGASKAAKKFGIPEDLLHQYNKLEYMDTPSMNAIIAGSKKKITGYFRITTFEGILDALKRGCPVVFNTNIWDWKIDPDGKVLNAHNWDKIDSTNHAMAIVGYDPEVKFDKYRMSFKIRQSWGTSEGDKGYYYVPADILWEKGTIDVWVPVVTSLEPDEPATNFDDIAGGILPVDRGGIYRHVAYVGAWQDESKCDWMVNWLRSEGFPAVKKYLKVFE
jgi:hypothetical protein